MNFSLSAKFNRFFIILGGGGRPAEKRGFLAIFGVPEVPYTGKTLFLDEKTTKNADEVSGFFTLFLAIFRPVYTGIFVKNPVFGLKLANFEEKSGFYRFSLSAKFNRFFIILGGVQLDLRIYEKYDLLVHRKSITDREGLGLLCFEV